MKDNGQPWNRGACQEHSGHGYTVWVDFSHTEGWSGAHSLFSLGYCAPHILELPERPWRKSQFCHLMETHSRDSPSRTHLLGKLGFYSSEADTCWVKNIQLPTQIRERIRLHTFQSLFT